MQTADPEVEVVMMKGKRSKRPRPDSPPLSLTMSTTSSELISAGVITPSPSHSGRDQPTDAEEEDMANCLILLAKGQAENLSPPPPTNTVEVYQCKTCNKSFPSFQALGGHRASHKKPNKTVTLEEKSALRENHEDLQADGPPPDDRTLVALQISKRVLGSPPNKSRVHECSICGAEFGSGQALGGHMRRHRPIPAAVTTSHGEFQEVKRARNLLSLDLNLPAPEDIDHHPAAAAESKFPFAATKEQVIVFSASALVDCHY
ncbi:Zinc finger protein ZAT5 [Sesamum alatum]|uniref:Zinc finger protein ZAT5 n=1 Tax=Sesamum alatum TaxID=300844 RepID=A0AAE1XX87_9LAMI|nr:Zinc finger protein ZAT5 [Sesamum alatum]